MSTDVNAVIIKDRNGCSWRTHPLVPGEWQIQITETAPWSDADLLPEDGPFFWTCGVYPCRVCPVMCSYEDLQFYERHNRSKAQGATE
jgi:hypothetical protein